MPNFKFEGFATGSAVNLSVQQGAASDTASVPSWGEASGTSSIVLVLSATRVVGVAPFGALYSADANSSEARVVIPFHDIEGIWNFDNPGNFDNLDNSPLWGTDWNVGYGPRGIHVHDTPGTYQVAHTAYDGAGSATETISVTVEDPDVVFAGADTAVVSSAGNFAGAPAGASQFSSLSAAISHIQGRTNGRLLLRADETFTSQILIEKSGRTYVGRFGHAGGERPLIDMSGGTQTAVDIRGAGHTEIVITDLRIRGSYDMTATSQPNQPGGSGISFSGTGPSNKPNDAHKTIWNVEIKDAGQMGIDCDGTDSNTPNRRLYIGNTRIVGWYNFGILGGDGGDWGLAGCVFRTPTGTVNGASKSGPPWWPDHGPFRLSRPNGMTVVSNCDFTSFCDWSAGVTSQSMQDVFRWNSGSHADQVLVMDRFRAEGGAFNIYNATGGAKGVTDNFVVIDRFHFIHTDISKYCLTSPMGGITWRNGIGVWPNVPAGASTGGRKMFSDDTDGAPIVPGAQQRRSELYSCALIDLRNDQNASVRGPGNNNRDYNPGGYENNLAGNSYFANNLLHAPNMVTGGETGHAPLSTVAQWVVHYDGERWEGAPVNTARAYGNAPTASFRPLPGSVAIGGASGKVSLLDFDGNLRADVLAGLSRAIPSIGPYEPDLEN